MNKTDMIFALMEFSLEGEKGSKKKKCNKCHERRLGMQEVLLYIWLIKIGFYVGYSQMES